MDKIFVICMQDVLSVSKLEYFLKNIVYQEDRFLFVCNRFKQNQENELGALIMSGKISVCEYIDEKEDGMMNLMYMQKEDILKTTAYMLE